MMHVSDAGKLPPDGVDGQGGGDSRQGSPQTDHANGVKAGPAKGVKFSQQIDVQNQTKDGQRVVTVHRSNHDSMVHDNDGTLSKSAAQRRRFWKKVALRCSPRYWMHVANKRLPVVRPESKPRVIWDVMIMCFVLYNVGIVPYQVGFSTPVPYVLEPLNNVIDIFFAFDICFNFRTAYMDNTATLVRDGKMIAVHYLKGWFTIDLVSTIPFDLLLTSVSENMSQTQLTALALLRTPRLLRLVRLLRMLDRIKGANFIRMLKLLFLMAAIAHWICCFWHLLYVLDDHRHIWTFDDLGDNSAEVTYYLQGYLNTLFIMVGNDVQPGNDVERLYCTFVLVLGACFYAIVVGNMSLLINNLNPTASRHRFKKDLINNSIRYLDIPKDLSMRINNYFDFLTQYNHPGTDGMNLIHQLPSSMAQDVSSYCYRKMIIQVPLFRDCEEAFITQLVMRLKLSVYLTSEVIFRIGDVGHEMYFISKGDVAVINGNQELLTVLSKGGFFGELALLATARRTAHCVSVSQCDLAMLLANDLVSALRDFPDSAARVRGCAFNRLKELQAAGTVADTPGNKEDAPDHLKKLNADDEAYGDEGEDDEDEEGSDGGDERGSGGQDQRTVEERAEEARRGSRVQGRKSGAGAGGNADQEGGGRVPAARRQSTVNFQHSSSLKRGVSRDLGKSASMSRDAPHRQPSGMLAKQASGISRQASRRRSNVVTGKDLDFDSDQPGGGALSRQHSVHSQPSRQTSRAKLVQRKPSSNDLLQRQASTGLQRQMSGQNGAGLQAGGKGGKRVGPVPTLDIDTTGPQWLEANKHLVGQMHTIVTRLNGKMDGINVRLEDMRSRMERIDTGKDDPFAQGPNAFAGADPLLDYDM